METSQVDDSVYDQYDHGSMSQLSDYMAYRIHWQQCFEYGQRRKHRGLLWAITLYNAVYWSVSGI